MSQLTPVDFDPFGGGELADAAPTTAPQREIWVASQMGEATSLAYNESITISCRGPFDLAAMRGALAGLPARHEALRSTLSADGKSLCVAHSLDLPVAFVDVHAEGQSAEEREQRLARIIRAEAETPFDLTRGPLVRAAIVRMGAEDHRVVLGAHHVVCDGWSFAVLLRDLGALYSSAVRPGSAHLLPVHGFATYARDESSRDGSREKQYWLARFAPLPEPLDLPVDRARPALRSVAAGRVDRPLPSDLVAALKKAGAREGASFFVTLFSAFGVLLSRLTSSRDIVIGVPAAGQSATDREMLVGHCANLLPIRVAIDPERTFSDLLRTNRSIVLDAYEHQRFTVGDVLSALKIPRDASRLPLVSVLFNLDTGMEGTGLSFEGLEVAFRANPRVAETFEVFLNAFESGGEVMLECQYSTGLWDRQTIEAWLAAYEAMLRAWIADRALSCAELPVLGEEDRAKVTGAWNATARAFPLDRTVLDEVREQARLRPDKAAVVDAGGAITYGELVARTEAVAAGLRRLGVARGDLVALAVDRAAPMVPGVLGILAAGAAYIPVDPDYPPARVARMLEKARLVIASPETRACLSSVRCEVVMLDALLQARPEPAAVVWDAHPEDRAYVLFTSGSTGVPKGVEVTHRNVLNFVTAVRREPGMSECDVLAAVVTLAFDMAGFEIFVPLATGATIVVADRDAIQDGRLLGELIREHAVTVTQATPSTYRLLKVAGFDPSGLRALAAGEPFPPDLAAWLLSHGASLTNCYGPTETTIWSTFHPVTEAAHPIPIGRPIANTTVHVLDENGELSAVGAFGELVIGGDGVARGYLDNPEMTAERFVPDRFSAQPGAHLYRTGDRARFRHDGVLEYGGRNDDQVKVRGHRVEIGEIETALQGLPSIAEGAIAVVRDQGADARLVAFVVPRASETVTATELRRHLRKSLPEAMVPSLAIEVKELPRTPNGKVDRRALARLASTERRRDQEVVPPSTDTERLLAELFHGALGVGPMSVHDNFFDLGGNSLTSMELVVEIENRTGVRIAPRTLLISSLAETARVVEEARGR